MSVRLHDGCVVPRTREGRQQQSTAAMSGRSDRADACGCGGRRTPDHIAADAERSRDARRVGVEHVEPRTEVGYSIDLQHLAADHATRERGKERDGFGDVLDWRSTA
jgi:hypothetical protein